MCWRLTMPAKNNSVCSKVKRFGSAYDGGYYVCMSPPYIPTPKNCLVYSFGYSFYVCMHVIRSCHHALLWSPQVLCRCKIVKKCQKAIQFLRRTILRRFCVQLMNYSWLLTNVIYVIRLFALSRKLFCYLTIVVVICWHRQLTEITA